MAVHFTDENFHEEVINSSIPVMVDFYADWCGPCKMMAPMVDKLSEEYEGRIKIGKINAEDNPEAAGQYDVMSIPTFLFIKDGQVVDTAVGGMTEAAMRGKLDALL
jgi:thioredoxin 1